MEFGKRNENALIAVYGDNEEQKINRAISLYLPDRDIRILTPEDAGTLTEAARNSVLVVIGIRDKFDKNVKLARILQEDPFVVADIIAYCYDGVNIDRMDLLGKHFDICVSSDEVQQLEFKKFLAHKITKGSKRLEGLIQEEEYRRLSDALSVAPVSIIIFDADKRAVFVSDHYFRAYPKIAPRLIRGLRVYDAFDMMALEEGIEPESDLYHRLKKFWYNLDGSINFTLEDRVSYRLKAITLPSNRGTVVIGQNITEHLQRLK